MFDKTNLIDGGLILSGLGISLSNLQNILSIIILIVDICWIIFKIIRKIYPKLKEYLKDHDLSKDEIDDLKNDIIEEIKGDGDINE